MFEVGGKLLYAHKPMLTLMSDTFNSMFSERWNSNKDEPIKIKDYSYDDFYQFLTFLYSGQCQLTDTNIYTMVDIAEFYGVNLFKKYCEKYLISMKITTENIFKLMDLADKYSLVQFKSSTHDFIMKQFQSFVDCDGFLKAEKLFVDELITAIKEKIKPEDLFQAIYKWTENQAHKKQSDDPNIDVNEIVKNEITDFLPHLDFNKMEMQFLIDFIVPRGFIFSYNELSKVLNGCFSQKTGLCDQQLKTKVKVTNRRGQTLHGSVIPDKTVVKNIESIQLLTCYRNYALHCWWNRKFTLPSTPSPIKRKEGDRWYLVYYYDGDIGVKHSSAIHETDYIISEMTAGASGFDTAYSCKIEIE